MNKKYYLSGIDWVIHSLDYATKKKTGCGNLSQLVLELDRKIDEKIFTLKLFEFLAHYPVLTGKVSRDYTLAPYWKISRRIKNKKIPFKKVILEKQTGLEENFSLGFELLNSSRYYVYFLLVENEHKSYLVFTFDHKLFDAYGAERFLFLLQRYLEKGDTSVKGFSPQGPFLDNWKNKFLAGKMVNRAFLELAKEKSVKVLSLPRDLNYKNTRFECVCFTKEQSQKIIDKANDCAGYLMTMPYLLAVVLRNIEPVFKANKVKEENFIVPVSMDARGKSNAQEKIFFNHLGFILFKIPQEIVFNEKKLLTAIKEQFYQQIKNNITKDMQEASMLLRIAPLAVIGSFLGIHFKGKNASLGFSFIGEGGFDSDSFMGASVNNLVHMPLVPVPPGIGVFFNQYKGRINLTISYLSGIISPEQAEVFVGNVKNDFLYEKK